jgi:hypothetical protein
MIVDLKLFTPGSELKSGLLTILELLPGEWRLSAGGKEYG